MTREEIVEHARTWQGVKWHHMGRSRHGGVDCVGLVIVTAAHFGVPITVEGNYRRTPHNDTLVRTAKKHLIAQRPPLKPGMVLILRSDIQPCHVGIYAEKNGRPSLIHACAAQRAVWEEPYEVWAKKFRMCLDFPGVED